MEICATCNSRLAPPPPPEARPPEPPKRAPAQSALPDDWETEAPFPAAKKDRTAMVIAGAVIGAVIVVAILIFVVVLAPPANPYPLEVGDYFRYTYSGTSASLSGTVTYEVIVASSLTYTFRTTYTGDIDEPSSTDTASAKGSIGKNFFYGVVTFIGNDTINTHYGIKLLKHYLQSETDCEIDVWADQGMDVPYKMVFTYHDSTYGVMTMELTETNVEWML